LGIRDLHTGSSAVVARGASLELRHGLASLLARGTYERIDLMFGFGKKRLSGRERRRLEELDGTAEQDELVASEAAAGGETVR
jgi:hypothetical protein